jgi:hypothetical protein
MSCHSPRIVTAQDCSLASGFALSRRPWTPCPIYRRGSPCQATALGLYVEVDALGLRLEPARMSSLTFGGPRPLSARSEVMMSAHPNMKLMANFCGMIPMMGMKSVKVMKTKKMVEARKRPKYMNTIPEEKLLMAF